MKKRITAILLVVLMLLPALVSCSDDAPKTEADVNVFTLHIIKDESTTDEAIKVVEEALNRTLFYRLGSCVEILAYTEDEYYDAIDAKYEEMEAYEIKKAEDKKNNKNNSKNNSDISDVSVDAFTGDDYIDLLGQQVEAIEKGEDYTQYKFERKEPRFDIFLITDYAKYYELASDGKLADIKERLNNEAKILNDFIHPTILEAATVNKKIYGVPLNTIIGEYSYIVFDKELLEQHKVDYETMQTLDDIQDYLELVAKENPDVTPLKNTADPTTVDFIFSSLSPAYVKDKYVQSTYESNELLAYYSVIQKFNALGYFGDGSSERAAVQFISGNEETIAQLEKETGREYVYSVYRNPVATNENCVQGVFAFSSYCKSNELKAAVDVVKELYTNPDLANMLAYGIEDVNYTLNDDGQVERLNDEYMITAEYSGNRFITYTLAGEDAEKWDKAKLQNQNAVKAVDIGFTLTPTEFKWEMGEDEEPLLLVSPDYLAIINGVTKDYIDDITMGTALELDLEAIRTTAEEGIEGTLRKELEDTYKAVIENAFKDQIRANYDLSTNLGQRTYDTASKAVRDELFTKTKSDLTVTHTKLYQEQLANMDYTEEELAKEVEKKVNDLLTDDFVNEAVERQYGDTIEALINSRFDSTVEAEANKSFERYKGTAEYENNVNASITSAEFEAELDVLLNSDLSATIDAEIDKLISQQMKEYFAAIIEACEPELKAAIDEFVDEVVATSKEHDGENAMTKEEVLFELGLATKVTAEEPEGEETSDAEAEEPEDSYEIREITMYEYVLEIIQTQYYKVFGDPNVAA